MQRQAAVTAYFSSNQLLLLVFALHDFLMPWGTYKLTAEQRQTAVTADFTSEQLLLFVFGGCRVTRGHI